MALEQEKIYTEEEYEVLIHEGLIEYDNGRIIYMTPPSRTHADITIELARVIGNYLKGKPCRVYHAPFDVRLNIAGSIKRVEPDISIICDKNKLTSKGCEGSPDLIIEVVSPNNKMHDYFTKLNWYQQAGVREYWIVDPDTKIIQVYLFEQNDVKQFTFSDTVLVGIFNDELNIDFSKIDLS